MGIDRKQLRSSAQQEIRSGNWQRAIDKFEQLVEDDPDDVRSRLKLADLYTRVDREQNAVESYREVGDRHARKDLYQKAVAVYKQALRLDPEDPELHRKVGEAYHRLDRLKDAAQALRRAQKRYKDQGERAEQVEVLEELVRLDPEDVGLRIQLAETYAKQDRTDDALEYFREAADMLEEEGRLDDYVQVAERIVFFDPEDVEVRKNAIDIYVDRNDHKRALKHLQVCFNNNPEDEETLRRLGETFLRLDRTDKAALVFKKLAQNYENQGRRDSARQIWTRVLDVDPTDETAQSALQRLGRQSDAPEETERERSAQQAAETREQAESAEVPTISGEQEREGDALDEVEFLDEEPSSGPKTPEPQRGVETRDGGGAQSDRDDANEFQDVPTEQIDQTLGSSPGAGGDFDRDDLPETAPSGHETPSDESESDTRETPRQLDATNETPTRAGAELGGAPSSIPEELDEKLDEADVFLKYELYDKARDLIQEILSQAPDLLAAYEKRRRLYAELDEPEAEASTLVDMARLCDDRREQAREYLLEASELGADDGAVARAASEVGIEIEEVQKPVAANPTGDGGPSLEEPTAALDEPPGTESDAAGVDESADSDEPMTLDPSEVEMVEDPGDEFDDVQESGPGDAIVEETEVSNEADFSDDELEAVEPVDEGAETDGGFGSAYETNPPEAPVDREESELGTAGGLNFSSEELDGAIDGIFDGRDEEQPQPTDDGVLAEVDALIDADDYDGAEQALQSVEQEYPDHPGIESRREQIRRGRAGGFERQPTGSRSLSGEFQAQGLDDGESVAEQVEQEEPDPVDSDVDHSSLELGLSYFEMEMYDEAIREFQDAIKDPDAADAAKYHIAICKAEKGNVDEAAEDLSRLLRYDQLSGDLREAAREKLDDLEGTRN